MPQEPTPASEPAVEAARAQAAARADAITGTPFTGRPQEDPQILTGLRARREILGQQLERVSERRQHLASELSNTSHAEGAVRGGLEKRLEVLDEQVVQLERDIVTTDRQLAGAPPALLAESREEPRVVHSGWDDEDALGLSAFTFGLGILVTAVARRIRRWRRRGERGVAGEAATAGAGPDPRIDRLAHAVDAIAVEVERIGEGQRFVTQLLAESRPRLAEYAAAEGAPTQGVPGTGR